MEMSAILIKDFLHGATVDAASTCEEAVESEETTDSDFSLVTDQPDDRRDGASAPESEEEDM